MKRRIVLFMLLGSACIASWSATEGEVAARDIEVLRAVLGSACQAADGKYQVVSSKPAKVTGESLPTQWKHSKELGVELRRRSQLQISWPAVEICDGAKIADEEKIAVAFDTGDRTPPGWEGFYRSFPGSSGLMSVSLPAFTRDGATAAVYLESGCDDLCGAGFFLELRLERGAWRIAHRDMAWIA